MAAEASSVLEVSMWSYARVVSSESGDVGILLGCIKKNLVGVKVCRAQVLD